MEFIHGVDHTQLKLTEAEYKDLIVKAEQDMVNEKKAKEEAAKIELADLLDINGAQN